MRISDWSSDVGSSDLIGLAPGSTRLLARRADDEDALEFDLQEERAFDEKFRALVESIAVDERPEWVTDTLAAAAGDLRNALEKAAPKVEFKVGGQVRRTRSEEHTSELQSLMRISYAVFCL